LEVSFEIEVLIKPLQFKVFVGLMRIEEELAQLLVCPLP
jgi:hypothetical protein